MAELRTYLPATTGTYVKPEVRVLTDGRVRVDWRATDNTLLASTLLSPNESAGLGVLLPSMVDGGQP